MVTIHYDHCSDEGDRDYQEDGYVEHADLRNPDAPKKQEVPDSADVSQPWRDPTNGAAPLRVRANVAQLAFQKELLGPTGLAKPPSPRRLIS